MTEQEIKQRYIVDMWWFKLAKLFRTLGEAQKLEREIAYYKGEYEKMRALYVRRGRPTKKAA